MTRRIFRYEVPIDGKTHEIRLASDPVFIFCRSLLTIEFWVIDRSDGPERSRFFTVIGTGSDMPPNGTYVGTAVAPDGAYVWHLIEEGL